MIVQQLAKHVLAGIKNVIPDLMFIGGVGSMCYGISMWSIPAAWVAGGAALVYVSLLASPK